MINKIPKEQIKESIEKLKKASTSPAEKLKIMQEMEMYLGKINGMVKDLVVTMKKEASN
jgi:hypothetical protein